MNIKHPALLLPLAILAVSLSAAAAGGPAPFSFTEQAALVRKVLLYDESLPARTRKALQVLVVGTNADESAVAVGALKEAGLQGLALKPDGLASYTGEAQAIYVMSGAPVAVCRDYSERRHLLSMTSNIGLVERGDVAVGFGKGTDERLEIVVNVNRVNIEQHQLAAGVLLAARVIGSTKLATSTEDP
jgi:hypothetical protein